MNVELTPAFVLHASPYRDTSLLLDVFSENYGRQRLIARGARNTNKKKINHFQLYQPLLLAWRGYGDLATVTNVETAKPAYLLTENAALCGLYLNELLVRLLPQHMAESDLFMHYEQALQALQSNHQIEVILRLFEKYLLETLGYGINLMTDADGRPIEAEKLYYYQINIGFLTWFEGCTYRKMAGSTILQLLTEDGFDEQGLQQCKQLMRDVIDYHLAGKKLNSRNVFAQMQHYAKI